MPQLLVNETGSTPDRDGARVEDYARIAQVWFDYCGIYCYGLDVTRTAYEGKSVHTTLELDRVLSQVQTALRAMP